MKPVVVDKRNGRLYGRSELEQTLSSLKDGLYKVEARKMHGNRTTQQNRWLWGKIYKPMLDGFIDAGWDDFTNEEEVHEFCKVKFAGKEIVDRNTGEVVTIPCRTSEMDTVEFSLYCMQLRFFAKEYLNIDIPEPDEYLLKNIDNDGKVKERTNPRIESQMC